MLQWMRYFISTQQKSAQRSLIAARWSNSFKAIVLITQIRMENWQYYTWDCLKNNRISESKHHNIRTQNSFQSVVPSSLSWRRDFNPDLKHSCGPVSGGFSPTLTLKWIHKIIKMTVSVESTRLTSVIRLSPISLRHQDQTSGRINLLSVWKRLRWFIQASGVWR